VVVETLGRLFSFLPLCPEYELGLGVPREPIALFGDPESPRLLGLETGRDLTEEMAAFCRQKARTLKEAGLQGFILKSKSPSCGLRSLEVRVHPGKVIRRGVGFWARALRDEFPRIPLVESWELEDPSVREAFVERVLALFHGKGESEPGP